MISEEAEAVELIRAQIRARLPAKGIHSDDGEINELPDVVRGFESAVDDYNASLFDPIGSQLEDARDVVTLFACQIAAQVLDSADITIEEIEPQPEDPHEASVAGVLGTCLRSLDAWSARPESRPFLDAPNQAIYTAESDRLAKGILGAARRGSALRSVQPMIATHGGELVLRGAMTAVAGVFLWVAQATGEEVENVALGLFAMVDGTV